MSCNERRAVLIDVDLVSRTDGIRFLLHALGEGPPEMGSILAATFLYIIDSPRTRAYLCVGTDLEVRNSRFQWKWFFFAKSIVCVVDRAVGCYGCLWEGPGPRRSNEGLCKGHPVDVENMEWYVVKTSDINFHTDTSAKSQV